MKHVIDSRIVVLGGCGRVGLPLAIALADQGLQVVAYDLNLDAVKLVNEGKMPFSEDGSESALARVLGSSKFVASNEPSCISQADVVVVVIGTPVDEFLNPDADAVWEAISAVAGQLRNGQLLVLRSTVFPGVSRKVFTELQRLGKELDISFCPERIAEGQAFAELYELPQIVSGFSESAVSRASMVFGHLTKEIVVCEPEEAELAKLFTNAWRYLKFAAANQFFMISNSHNIDFARVRHAITYKYPRAADMPGPGFAAGPCLFKDTLQLASFYNNNFTLGYASLMVNEGLPLYIASRMEERFDLPNSVVGILGMSFKAESDDTRSSLSFKLRRVLKLKASEVLCTDPFAGADPRFKPLEEVVSKSDVLVIATPHNHYKSLVTDKPVIDVWNVFGNGSLV